MLAIIVIIRCQGRNNWVVDLELKQLVMIPIIFKIPGNLWGGPTPLGIIDDKVQISVPGEIVKDLFLWLCFLNGQGY